MEVVEMRPGMAAWLLALLVATGISPGCRPKSEPPREEVVEPEGSCEETAFITGEALSVVDACGELMEQTGVACVFAEDVAGPCSELRFALFAPGRVSAHELGSILDRTLSGLDFRCEGGELHVRAVEGGAEPPAPCRIEPGAEARGSTDRVEKLVPGEPRFDFQLDELDLLEALKHLVKVTGSVVSVDPSVHEMVLGIKVSIATPGPVSRSGLIPVFEKELGAAGLRFEHWPGGVVVKAGEVQRAGDVL
jgi:hypothetical protein